jgi:hypothetical protein
MGMPDGTSFNWDEAWGQSSSYFSNLSEHGGLDQHNDAFANLSQQLGQVPHNLPSLPTSPMGVEGGMGHDGGGLGFDGGGTGFDGGDS